MLHVAKLAYSYTFPAFHFGPGENWETSLGLIRPVLDYILLARPSHGHQLRLAVWSCLRDLTGWTIRNPAPSYRPVRAALATEGIASG